MRQTICPSTALHPLGAPPGRKLLRVSSGPHAGREAVLFQAAPGEIACAWADRPYAGWSPPAAVTAQAEDSPFDAAIMPDGTIHLVYTEAGTGYLAARKLTLTGGAWVPGPPVTVVDRPIARYPSLAILPDGALWVCWTGIESGTHRLFAKSSSDGGTTWGAGPSDPGESLTLGASSAFGRLAVGPSDLYAAYTNGGMQLCVRSRPLGGGAWGTSTNLAAGENFDEHFDVAAGVDGRLGVVWDNGALRYREFDGDQWAPTVVLDGAGGSWPQLV
ncbi:MAG TPA: sialidase family protein, partial [candidate division Zixibacteria bacterium]|nr:sialidase family protein [candidate division Zixibacteria bacterium]